MSILINKIYNESCLDTMKRFDDNIIDCIITSPPYNMNLRIRNGKYCSRQIIKEFSTKYNNFNDNLPIEEFYTLHKIILNEMLRVSKIIFYNISVVTGSKQAFFKLIGDFAENIKDIFVWDKLHGQPAMQVGVVNRRTELIIVLSNKEDAISRKFKQAEFIRGFRDDIFQIKSERSKIKGHNAVFPEKLIEQLLLSFTDESNLIYDPFSGTGTVARVAKRLNRNYIGSEIDSNFVNISKELLHLD